MDKEIIKNSTHLQEQVRHTIMEYIAIWKLKPSDLEIIPRISWKYTKTSFYSWIKCIYQLVFFYHLLKIETLYICEDEKQGIVIVHN